MMLLLIPVRNRTGILTFLYENIKEDIKKALI